MSTFIQSKSPVETKVVDYNLLPYLTDGETCASSAIGLISPVGVTATVVSTIPSGVQLSFDGGVDGTTYGVRVDVTTNLGRVFSFTVALLVSSQLGTAYTITNPEGLQTLVDTVYAGETVLGNANFMFDPDYSPVNTYVTWELLDNEGTVYAQGNAFQVLITRLSTATRVEAQALITVPGMIPINLEGLKYQIRWKLTAQGINPAFSYENVKVQSTVAVPIGVEDTVEFQGDTANLTLVLPRYYDHVTVAVYKQSGSTLVAVETELQSKQKCAEGYVCQIGLDTANMAVALDPYVVVWKYWNDNNVTLVYRESGRLFLINASLMSVTDDMRQVINRSRSTIAHSQDMLFTVPTLLAFLRIGKDEFNSAHGVFTNFDMTDATGGIRAFWLRCSFISALRSQFLAEGEKAFNMSGQSISVDVDRTQYYDSLASAYQSQLDQELKPFKQNLIKKGIISGTGNMDNIGLRRGAIGSIGVNISPASNFGRFTGKLNLR